MLAVIGAGALWLARRRAPLRLLRLPMRQEHAAAARLHSQSLTPQASVHVVQWNGEDLLLGCTAQQVTLLARRPAAGSPGEHS